MIMTHLFWKITVQDLIIIIQFLIPEAPFLENAGSESPWRARSKGLGRVRSVKSDSVLHWGMRLRWGWCGQPGTTSTSKPVTWNISGEFPFILDLGEEWRWWEILLENVSSWERRLVFYGVSEPWGKLGQAVSGRDRPGAFWKELREGLG